MSTARQLGCAAHCIDPHPIHLVPSSLKVEKPQLGRHAHEGPPSSFCVWIPLNLFDSEEPLNFGTYLESDLQGNQCARTFSRVPWESFRTSGPGSILCFYLSVLWRGCFKSGASHEYLDALKIALPCATSCRSSRCCFDCRHYYPEADPDDWVFIPAGPAVCNHCNHCMPGCMMHQSAGI